MKLRPAAFIAALAFAPAAFAAESGIEFSGVLTADGQTRLALTDTATKTTTWVTAGEVFNGYSVARYDAKEDAVFLKKNGQEIRLGLVAAKTIDAKSGVAARNAAPALSANPTTMAVRANLRQLANAARQLQTQKGITTVSYADLVGPGKPIAQLAPVAGENYSTLTFGPNVTAVSVTTSSGATVSLDLAPTAPVAATAAAPAASAAGAAAPTGQASETAATTAPVATSVPPANPNAAPTAPTVAATTEATAPAPATATPPAPVASAPVAGEALPPTGRQPASPSYTVQGGDTLESIAQLNGVTVQQLRELNPILNASSLRAGETIRIR